MYKSITQALTSPFIPFHTSSDTKTWTPFGDITAFIPFTVDEIANHFKVTQGQQQTSRNSRSYQPSS